MRKKKIEITDLHVVSKFCTEVFRRKRTDVPRYFNCPTEFKKSVNNN
jgi:hypothetical protein